MCNTCAQLDLATRAQQELVAAMVALQQAGALFSAIEKACITGDKDLPFLLAQIGAETSSTTLRSGSRLFPGRGQP